MEAKLYKLVLLLVVLVRSTCRSEYSKYVEKKMGHGDKDHILLAQKNGGRTTLHGKKRT
jgi:hypothetical protein